MRISDWSSDVCSSDLFIEKPFEKAALITAVETAFERLADAEGRASRAADATILIAGLSAREQDVLKGLAQGLPNKSIAFDLGISSPPVEVHHVTLTIKTGGRRDRKRVVKAKRGYVREDA